MVEGGGRSSSGDSRNAWDSELEDKLGKIHFRPAMSKLVQGRLNQPTQNVSHIGLLH